MSAGQNKNAKLEEAGGEWQIKSLDELIDIKHGFAFKGEFIHDYPKGDILLTPGNFAIGGGFKSDKLKYYDGLIPEDFILNEGDLIVTMTDLSKQADTLGYPAFVPFGCDRRYLHNQRIGKIILKSPNKIDKKFLHYLLCHHSYRNEILASATGTTVKHTSPERIKRFRFCLPPMNEQRAIAHILGTLDDKIELNRRTNETLEAMAQALFKFWFVDFGPVRAKMEGRWRRGQSLPGLPAHLFDLFPDRLVDSELGEIPEGWEIQPVYNIATYINGASYSSFQPNDQGFGLPIIKIAELKGGITSQTRFSEVQMPKKYEITFGDILFSWSGNPDTSIDIFIWSHAPAWLNQHIFRVLPKQQIERTFVVSTLKFLKPIFAEIARDKQTTGLGHVTVEDLKKLLVIKPSSHIMQEWDLMALPFFDKLLQNEVEINNLSILRDTLLPKLISGELRVKQTREEQHNGD